VTTGSFKRLIGRLAVGALVLSGVSLAVAGPANAGLTPSVATVVPTTQTVSDIRPDELTYLGWHEGHANPAPAFFVGWDGVHLGDGNRSQIINGLVDTGAAGIPVTGADLLALITGSTISVTSGEVSAQVAVTTVGGWGTLRPAVPASTSTPAAPTDMWMSSQNIGTVVKNTEMSLGDLLSALDAQGNLRYSAYGFQAEPSTPLAVVSGMTWGSDSYAFSKTVKPCLDVAGKNSTNLAPNGWDFTPSYVGGHHEYTENGLRIWTDLPDLTLDKSAGLVTTDFALDAAGVPAMEYVSTSGEQPGINMVLYVNGAWKGTLVKEPLFDDWWINKTILGLPAGPNPGYQKAYGTLSEIVRAYALNGVTDVRIKAVGYSLGSGAVGDGIITSITAGCAQYTFNYAAPATTTKLVGTPSSTFGTDVDYTATVSISSPAAGIPTGDVQFWSNASKLGDPVPLVDGKATYTVKGLPIGATTITAKFLGSASSYLASEDSASQTVTTAPTTITVPSPDGTLVGSTVVLTATVGSGAGVPTGKVEFSVDGGQVTSVNLVDGKAAFQVTKVPVGITSVFAEYLGDSTHHGSSVVTDIAVAFPKATGTPNEIYITHVYRDLFGRNPDPAGMKLWTAKLDVGTSRAAVANAITYSTEYRSGMISDVYWEYLGRTPDPAGLQSWLGAMSRGLTVSQMESGFMSSTEYYAASGDTDWAWVGQMYSDVLGRQPATSEVKFWVQRLSNGSSRQQVSMGFLLSTEHLSTVVNDEYVALLHRNLDPIGQATWVRILQAGGRDEAIIAGIVASKEYFSQV
jgi:Bacterial Ig-like domain (group 3)/Domain of unknown function (DUF4214)